jgi:hypothetical protein
MPKKYWPEHPAIGVTMTIDNDYGNYDAVVKDARPGPMVTSFGFENGEALLEGTVRLKVRPVGGKAFDDHWLPPMNGNKLLKMLEDLRIKNENS